MSKFPRRIVCSTTTEICTSYASYLRSNHWKNIKAEFQASPSCKRKCYVCGSRHDVHHHHRSYENLGKEKPRDIVELCNSCHQRVHGLVGKGKINNKSRKFIDICFAVEQLKMEETHDTPRKMRKYVANVRVLTFDDL